MLICTFCFADVMTYFSTFSINVLNVIHPFYVQKKKFPLAAYRDLRMTFQPLSS